MAALALLLVVAKRVISFWVVWINDTPSRQMMGVSFAALVATILLQKLVTSWRLWILRHLKLTQHHLDSVYKSKCHPFKNKFVRIPNPIKKRQKILQRSKQKRVQLNYFIVVGFNKRLSASSSLLFSRVSSLQTSKVICVFEMVK